MDWSVKPVEHIQQFLDGSWPMPKAGVGPIHSRKLFDDAEARRLFHKVIATYPMRSKHRVFTQAGTGSLYDPNVRNTDDLSLSIPFADEDLVGRLAEAGERGVYELTGKIVKLRSTTPLQILGYEAEGKFVEHADSHIYSGKWIHNTPERKFSSICWLSSYRREPVAFNEFNGGKIHFPHIQLAGGVPITIAPEAGQFVVFPSHPVFAHSVVPVVKGYRVALVNFWDTDG